MLIMEGNGPSKSKENAKKDFQMCLEDATVAQSFVHWRQQKGIRQELFHVISWLHLYYILNNLLLRKTKFNHFFTGPAVESGTQIRLL